MKKSDNKLYKINLENNYIGYDSFYEKKIKKLQEDFDLLSNSNFLLNDKIKELINTIKNLKKELKNKEKNIFLLNNKLKSSNIKFKIKKTLKENNTQTNLNTYNIGLCLKENKIKEQKYWELKNKFNFLKLDNIKNLKEISLLKKKNYNYKSDLKIFRKNSDFSNNLNNSNFILNINESQNQINKIHKLIDSQRNYDDSFYNSEYSRNKSNNLNGKKKFQNLYLKRIYSKLNKKKKYDIFNFRK